MSRLRSVYPFPVDGDYQYRLAGRDCRLHPDDVRALTLLAEIAESADLENPRWLIPLRSHIREIEDLNPRAALIHVIERTESPLMRVLAIWLRGRCRGTFGAAAVARHARSSHRSMRKHVVQCLKRLSAWSELRRIEWAERDRQIRQLARPASPKPYAARLARFSRHMTGSLVCGQRCELFLAPGVDLTSGRRPKPVELIRMLLERIHRLVTGQG